MDLAGCLPAGRPGACPGRRMRYVARRGVQLPNGRDGIGRRPEAPNLRTEPLALLLRTDRDLYPRLST